jgi:hypothetical protein
VVVKNEDMTYSAEIDGENYVFSLWSASKGIETLAELSAIAGDFATAVSAVVVDAGGLSGTVSADLVGKAVSSLAKGLSINPKATLALVRRLTTDGVLCENRPVVFDQHFKGRTLHTMKVVRAGLEVQYADFFTVFDTTKAPPRLKSV